MVVVVVLVFVVCVCVSRHAGKRWKKTVCGFKNASVCTFKTSPCVPATRPHVETHVDVLPAHTVAFLNVDTKAI